jgi:hypothetical protein
MLMAIITIQIEEYSARMVKNHEQDFNRVKFDLMLHKRFHDHL